MTTTVRGSIKGQYGTVAEAVADLTIKAGQTVKTSNSVSGTVGGGAEYVVESTTKPANGVTHVQLDTGDKAVLVGGAISSSYTVLIPTHFPTLQEAVDVLGPVNHSSGATGTLQIETGHTLSSGFRVQDGDYSHLHLTSVDVSVPVTATFTLQSDEDLDAGVPRSNSIGFLGVRAKLPKWDIVLDMAGNTNVSTALQLDHHSHIIVTTTKGVINNAFGVSEGTNLRVTTGSKLHAYQSVFTGAQQNGAAITAGSTATLAECDFSNAGLTGLDVSRGSTVYANTVIAANCQRGIYVRRSWLSCQNSDLSNNSVIGLWASIGSRVAALGTDYTNSPAGVKIEGGSLVDVSAATANALPLDPSYLVGARDFNQTSGYGLVTYEDKAKSDVGYLTASTTVSNEGATLVSVASLTYSTIYENNVSAATIQGGVIYGSDVGLRVTIDGVVVLNDISRLQGKDGAGNSFSCTVIPPCRSEGTLKVELYNRSSTTQEIGWRLYRV